MPTLNIDGQRVKVDDGFLKLSPEQQSATVDEIASSLKSRAAPAPTPAKPAPQITQPEQMAELEAGLRGMPAGPAGGLLAAAKRLPGALLEVGREHLQRGAAARKKELETQGDVPTYEGLPVSSVEAASNILGTPKQAIARAYSGKKDPLLEGAIGLTTLSPLAAQSAGTLGKTVKGIREARTAAKEAKAAGAAAKAATAAPVAAVAAAPVAEAGLALDAMKAAAAGKFNQQASIHDLVTQSGLSREKVHKALLREAQAGNISLHGSTIAEARYPEAEQKNWLRVPGEPQPFASFAIRPKAAAPAGASPAGTSPGGPGPPAGAPPIPPRGPGPPAGGLPLPPRAGPPPTPRPAAAPPAAPKDFIRDVADELHALGGHSVASEREMLTYLQGMQREFPVISSPKAQEAMYRRFERGGLGALSPEEQVVWNKYIAPLKQREQAAYVSAKQGLGKTVDISDLDPNYMHRQAADHTPAFTIGGAHPDPVFGVRGGGGLPKQAVSMRSPKYVALDPVDPKDRFKLVQDIGEGQAIEWENNKKTVRAIDDGKLKPGEAVEIGGKDYTVRRAISDEVEQNTPTRYVLNAAYNTAVNTLKLEAIDRNIATLNRLKQTGAQWMTRSPATAPKGWIETKLPQLKGYVMDPRLAHTIDDFYSPGFGSDHWIEVLRRTNHAIAGTMFWNPTPHALNVMGHWYVSRGWQWATPQGYWRLMRDGFKAVKEVTTQGPLYRDLLRNSSSMFFGGVMNREFETLLARKMGMEIARDPARWGPVMKRLGWPVNRAADFGALMYEGSRRAMWWANDIFMMQRVMELKRRGLTTVEAIREAEKHIPNYRVPPEVLGSRLLSVAMQDPLLTIFNRYHYGAMKSWASMVNDLVRGKTGKERWDAVGQWMAAGLAAFVIYPVLDQAVRKVTGNEAATVRRRGPFSYSAAAMGGVQNMFEDYLPEAANENLKAATGDTKGFSDLLASMLIPSPLITQAVEASTGRETWSGRLIAEPKGTSLERGVQIGDHLLQGLLAPYGTVSRAAGSEQPAQALPAEVLGWKLPSEASQAYKPKQERRDIRSVARRKTRGVLERGLQAIREYGGTTE